MKHGRLKLLFILVFSLFSFCSFAELIEGKYVKIQILDKITANIKNLDIPLNHTQQHGSLKIEIYMCYKQPPEEIPEDYVLLKIFDTLNDENRKIYQGWMISSSPSATPFEHPIYDVWLKECVINNS